MADILTIRLEQIDRDILEHAARERGLGLSGFVRLLAEAEATGLRRERIRPDGDRVLNYVSENPKAQAEIDEYGAPKAIYPSVRELTIRARIRAQKPA